jgi:hypothetical protein
LLFLSDGLVDLVLIILNFWSWPDGFADLCEGFMVTTRMLFSMSFSLQQVCFLRIIEGRLLGFITWSFFYAGSNRMDFPSAIV